MNKLFGKSQGIEDFDSELTEIGVQAQISEDVISQLNIKNCEKDKVIPWDSPELRRPICSWSTYPSNPSPQLNTLCNLSPCHSLPSPIPLQSLIYIVTID